jgi:SAM-dependent methyltransferase
MATASEQVAGGWVGTAAAESWTSTACLFCGESASDREFYPARLDSGSFSGFAFSARRSRRREHYRIVRCENCGLVRSDPVIDEDRFNALYAASQFVFSEEEPHACRTYVDLLNRLVGNREASIASLMEIGCSTGFFLDAMVGQGVRVVTGFEPSRDCVEHAAADIRVHIVNDVYSPEQLGGATFDVVCGFHVFDHLRDPLTTLQSVVRSLNPRGHVLLVCHDVEHWTARLLGEHSPIFDVEHIYLFSRTTMRRLLERAGFEAIEVGPVTNAYPLAYWLRMLPATRALGRWLPAALRCRMLRLRGGNLYGWGRKAR